MASTPKVWFVTSAFTGFGHVVTKHALQQGDNVVAVLPLKSEELSLDMLSKYPSQVLVLSSVDVRDPNELSAAFDNALERFGRVDIVLNNPGLCIISEAEGMSEEHGREMFDTLLWGAVNVSREAVRTFRDRNSTPGGRLLQVSSWTTLKAVAGFAHYAAAKTALECFSHGMAIELDPSWNIKISVVQPAFFWECSPGNIVVDPIHPAYGDRGLPSRITRDLHSSESAVTGHDEDPKKLARMIHRLAYMDDLPLFLPLHRVALEAARERGEGLIQVAEDYASWSEDVYLNKN